MDVKVACAGMIRLAGQDAFEHRQDLGRVGLGLAVPGPDVPRLKVHQRFGVERADVDQKKAEATPEPALTADSSTRAVEELIARIAALESRSVELESHVGSLRRELSDTEKLLDDARSAAGKDDSGAARQRERAEARRFERATQRVMGDVPRSG